MAGEDPFEGQQASDDRAPFQDDLSAVLGTRRIMPTVAVSPHVFERPMIGREGVLIQRDRRDNRLAREPFGYPSVPDNVRAGAQGKVPESREGIAHGERER